MLELQTIQHSNYQTFKLSVQTIKQKLFLSCMLLLSCTFWLQNLSGVWLPALSPTWNCFPSFSHYLTTSLHGLRCHLFSLKLFLSQFLTLSLTKSSPLYEAVVTSFTHVDKEALCSILSIIFGAISSCLKSE